MILQNRRRFTKQQPPCGLGVSCSGDAVVSDPRCNADDAVAQHCRIHKVEWNKSSRMRSGRGARTQSCMRLPNSAAFWDRRKAIANEFCTCWLGRPAASIALTAFSNPLSTSSNTATTINGLKRSHHFEQMASFWQRKTPNVCGSSSERALSNQGFCGHLACISIPNHNRRNIPILMYRQILSPLKLTSSLPICCPLLSIIFMHPPTIRFLRVSLSGAPVQNYRYGDFNFPANNPNTCSADQFQFSFSSAGKVLT